MKSSWIAAVALLAACGGGGDEPTKVADDAVQKVEDGVSSITKSVKITEDNDPNDSIGRPGSYEAATVFYDSRAECDDPEVIDVSCGAKIEVFADEGDAQARKDYLEEIIKASSGLITEYDYLDGATLLRVSGNLKPSEAEEYEAAFN